MCLLPVAEMVLRRVRGSGIPGSSVYVQHLTLWLGFWGAVLATGTGKHLGLATTNLLPPGRVRTIVLVYGSIVSATTTLVLAYASYGVVNANRASTSTLAGGIPEWWSECIVPVAIAAMAIRFIWVTPGGWLGRATTFGATLACAFGLSFASV